jgi:CheY-like chemotaxis protein
MRDEAFEAGCVDVLEKPVEFPHLKQVLASHLT